MALIPQRAVHARSARPSFVRVMTAHYVLRKVQSDYHVGPRGCHWLLRRTPRVINYTSRSRQTTQRRLWVYPSTSQVSSERPRGSWQHFNHCSAVASPSAGRGCAAAGDPWPTHGLHHPYDLRRAPRLRHQAWSLTARAPSARALSCGLMAAGAG